MMATRPALDPDGVPAPDIIRPQSPDETPPLDVPEEAPMREPDEVGPVDPDYDQPARGPDELPPPPD
ncbi:hypothetical protein [Sphingobium amiense]|uniref:hypothetical protein n=1 Tax=Sphingobium amiense TaxID=135719 RepID=UPI0038CD20B5